MFILSAFWQAKPYLLDVASHLLPHALILTVLFWFLTAVLTRKKLRHQRIIEGSVWSLLLLAVLLLFSSPARPVRGELAGYERIRIATYNTYNKLSDPALAVWLTEQRVDLIALIDPPYSMTRTNLLPEELKAHTLARPLEGHDLRLAIASRYPFEHAPLVGEPHHTNQRSFVAHGTVIVTTANGARFRFAPMHPVSPRTKGSWRASLRETQRESGWIAEARASDGLPWIIGGDFNATPGSRLWREFSNNAGLASPVTPFLQGTWPAGAPRAFALPIDRVWASPGVRFGSVTVGPRLASDHRPVVFEVYVPIPDATDEIQSDQ